MLSDRALGFLEGLAAASSTVYQEGGLLFTFKFAYQQAHRRLKESSESASFTLNASRLGLSHKAIEELGRFFQGSLGEYTKEKPSRNALAVANALIEHLQHDLQFQFAALQVEDEDYGMKVQIEMIQQVKNNLYCLELWWSVD
ncbi:MULTISPECIES: hypothetical protein [Pseudomonas]|uniref:Uncharacterized protein n=1 Tax=Pseudomonas luteola TaxID=47886 RepID=A0A2X2D7X3_PSELU|nr:MULTISPECIES: hypothetical protein [Pseudomonas]ENA28051.1 hypothetical protein HMPREF1487_08954 [Pseudomonas sp. HPB0071]MBF8641242.1 hypothetical protein [Pseudomonas zeshuii]RRW49910.1 hypothetical protein EGJ50_03685 [Pseudomonas luteola]SHJ03847.1 hypothetical protein SAMN05216295_106217 [Pseudomonas zeshuii]SPZ16288.1 Uncharacterised protein [Pseudomonas luteola]